MNIIKDASYWTKSANLYKSKEWWKEYNQKRKEYLLLKKRESRLLRNKIRGLVVDNLVNKPVVDIPDLVVDTKLETVVDKVVVDQSQNQVVDIKVIDRVQPVNEKVVDTVANPEIETYNQEVYKRASARCAEARARGALAGTTCAPQPKRFFTFPNGQKIVRPICGCNLKPNQDPKEWFNYTWCLDSCAYFIGWRNKAINQAWDINPEKTPIERLNLNKVLARSNE